ncbi:hypothetical protein K505DRAFT_328361 [Melanomma pulvis-pyrius CBS 109.77]|uniref:SnoaL-like domain-containing protein n=1 Tax=Melanomma pulvis-pyrius CBS 109.77 TaxID=1314802 RepID=A0A6A6WZ68_9PLEO|nr:hypothetical protein K505DRAFT_328361 [Melanomma pulvis-pyrius CBS 109.77]
MSSLHATAASFLAAFDNLSASEHISLRAPTCSHIFAPASLNPPPPKTNTAFAEHVTKLGAIIKHFPVTAKEIHVNEAGRQITIWATGVPEFREEVKGKKIDGEEGGWEYMGEYIFVLDVDEDGKIKRILEFLDSKNTMRLLEMVKKARENLAATSTTDTKEEKKEIGF